MDCKKLLTKLYEVIDNEACQEDTAKVREHLTACKKCMSRYQFEQMFKTFVTEKSAKSVESGTNDILKINILSQIDKIDKEMKAEEKKPFRFSPVLIATAAAIVICFVTYFSVDRFYQHKTEIEPFEHVYFETDSDSQFIFASAINAVPESKFTVKDMQVTFDDKMDNVAMLDACSCVLNDTQLSHIRLMYDNSRVSILIGKASEVNLPDFDKIVIDGVTVYQHTCKHCNMLYRIDGDAIIIAIAKNLELNLEPVVSSFKTI